MGKIPKGGYEMNFPMLYHFYIYVLRAAQFPLGRWIFYLSIENSTTWRELREILYKMHK